MKYQTIEEQDQARKAGYAWASALTDLPTDEQIDNAFNEWRELQGYKSDDYGRLAWLDIAMSFESGAQAFELESAIDLARQLDIQRMDDLYGADYWESD